MTSETTPEMLAMADRIAEEVAYSGRHPQIELEHRRAALAAIKLTTELAAKLADEKADAMPPVVRVIGTPPVALRRYATALRNGEHYRDR